MIPFNARNACGTDDNHASKKLSKSGHGGIGRPCELKIRCEIPSSVSVRVRLAVLKSNLKRKII